MVSEGNVPHVKGRQSFGPTVIENKSNRNNDWMPVDCTV